MQLLVFAYNCLTKIYFGHLLLSLDEICMAKMVQQQLRILANPDNKLIIITIHKTHDVVETVL